MLYLVGRDLGNPLDNTLHAALVLSQCDFIATEDTRSFQKFYQKLCANFPVPPKNPNQKILPFHDRNEYKLSSTILAHLYQGKSVAIISESGMPIINDPGSFLLSQVRAKGLEVTIIPSGTAFTSALAGSGITFDEILFLGYLPKKSQALIQKLQAIANFQNACKSKIAITAYESSHRITKTLETLASLPHLRVIICKDLSKSYEQVHESTDFQTNNTKGEYVLIMQFSK